MECYSFYIQNGYGDLLISIKDTGEITLGKCVTIEEGKEKIELLVSTINQLIPLTKDTKKLLTEGRKYLIYSNGTDKEISEWIDGVFCEEMSGDEIENVTHFMIIPEVVS